jgi:hypothetical protein
MVKSVLPAILLLVCIVSIPTFAGEGSPVWLSCNATGRERGKEPLTNERYDKWINPISNIFVWDAQKGTLSSYRPKDQTLNALSDVKVNPEQIKLQWSSQSDTLSNGAQTTWDSEITIDRRTLSYWQTTIMRFSLDSDINTYATWTGNCSVIQPKPLKKGRRG